MNNKLNKKAQITIFIIVAVIIVISAISFFIIRSQLIESAKEDEVETAIWANSIKNYITDCSTETSIKGFQELGWHGGFVDPKDPTNNCLDVAIITAPEKRTQKTKDKLKIVAGRVLNK